MKRRKLSPEEQLEKAQKNLHTAIDRLRSAAEGCVAADKQYNAAFEAVMMTAAYKETQKQLRVKKG